MKKIWVVAAFLLFSVTSVFAQKSEVYISSSKAIGGYDPVAYFTMGKPVMGNEKYTFQWKNANWQFSSKENLNAFSQNPDKYAPQYGGYCAYGMSEGKKASTDPNAWTIVEGKLYLNYNPDVKTMWNKNQSERIVKADKNWPELKNKE